MLADPGAPTQGKPRGSSRVIGDREWHVQRVDISTAGRDRTIERRPRRTSSAGVGLPM
ncbi:hypothetical protein [Burkholderia sp. IMCC1007]|uniref:hypothetical protein n=1 Tax=Burkholderia sp. IMCC1007 TaxID=3004104 RepID=UPI0022B3E9CF|nr:hypothetical protein [Burkholderia sp. IMCC1007]